MKHILEIIHQKLLKILDLFDSALMLLGSYTLAQYKDFLGIIGLGITMAGSPLLYVRNDGFTTIMNMVVGRGGGLTATNTVLGAATFSNSTGGENVAIGYAAMNQNNSGTNNTAVGYAALLSNNSGNFNVGIGGRALNGANSSYNIAVGYGSLYQITGDKNVGVGHGVFFNLATGTNNTALGYNAGSGVLHTIGDNNVFIGYMADVSANSLTNAIAIGANATVGASNSMRLGNGVNVGIDIAVPLAKNHIFGIDATTKSNLRLEPVTNVTEDTTGNTVNTINNTTVALETIAIPIDTVVMVESYVTCRKTGGAGIGTTGDGNSYIRTVKAKNLGGVVTIGVVQSSFTSEDIAPLDATFAVSGTDIVLNVTGANNDNITWNSITKKYKV